VKGGSGKKEDRVREEKGNKKIRTDEGRGADDFSQGET